MPNIIPVPGRSRNIRTLDKSLYTRREVRFVAVQGVVGEGAIEPHDHSQEKLVELVYLTNGSVYGGLDDPRIVKAGRSAAVPIGVTHGNLASPSKGQWLSVKVFGSARYLAQPVSLDEDNMAHTFEADDALLTVGVSNTQKGLDKLLAAAVKSRGTGYAQSHREILGLPLLNLADLPTIYESVLPHPSVERYLGIEWNW